MSFHFIFVTNFIHDKNPLYGIMIIMIIDNIIVIGEFLLYVASRHVIILCLFCNMICSALFDFWLTVAMGFLCSCSMAKVVVTAPPLFIHMLTNLHYSKILKGINSFSILRSEPMLRKLTAYHYQSFLAMNQHCNVNCHAQLLSSWNIKLFTIHHQ